jgi:CubicO group peptidase (beta-lactamase class C family)
MTLHRKGLRAALSVVVALAASHAAAQWRPSTPAEQALDAAAFQSVAESIAGGLPDVQGAVVALRGRVVYEFYRDGSADTLREQMSVSKSALSVLAGVALGQGRIASLDQPVVALVPEWAALNPDPRAASITVRHLLTMTAGFEINDPTGTAAPLAPREGWARRLVAEPGQTFAYDNSVVAITTALIEKVAGMPLPDYARQELVAPLGLREPGYQRVFQARTVDMARLGQLMLQKGMWDGKQLVPASFALDAARQQNAGGSPVGLRYGFMWWVPPSDAPRPNFLASGYAGQFIWVDPALELVIAVNSTVSPQSQQRGQAFQLIRHGLYPAVRKRAQAG